MQPERRTLLKILSATALPLDTVQAAIQCAGTAPASDLANYKFVFFTPAEQALLENLMELIIPSDAHSPGAKAARVPAFADLLISTGTDRARSAWKAGLAAFATAATTQPLEAVLAKAADEEASPQSDLGRFFIDLKRMTVDGYYTSTLGIMQELGYIGNQHLTSAPGCDHPEHKEN